VKQDIRVAAVGDDEPIAFGDVEPLHPTGDFHEGKGMPIFRDARRDVGDRKLRLRVFLAQVIGSSNEYNTARQSIKLDKECLRRRTRRPTVNAHTPIYPSRSSVNNGSAE
jgi:hypothetical protein